ncbi:hypothetical protein [uncultured Litoreibacter sp.]|uniref:hypothetical protein n=1 Tax=uncultured Litoreibacter sp. TaxID=1392394 RepID=UPI00260DEF4C|nr:hypothetical protein [uncultured Litoreibacter sp.]
MKITRNLPEQLIVENRPWILSIALVAGGLIFFGIGLSVFLGGETFGLLFMAASVIPFGLLFAFARRVQVLFLKEQGTLTFRRRTLMGASEVQHDLASISEAIVQTSHGSDGAPTHRVALIIPEGESAGTHPITLAYDNFSDHHGMANTINTWLAQAR